MEHDTLKMLAQVAGIGGIAVGGAVMIFRDLIRRNIFPMLTKQHAFELIRLIVILSFLIAIAGIGAWLKTNQPAQTQTQTQTKYDVNYLPAGKQQAILAARAQIEKAVAASVAAKEAAEEAERAAIRAQHEEPYTKIDEKKGRYKYAGEWRDGQRMGFGVILYLMPKALGEKFAGNFKDDVRVRGVYTYPPYYSPDTLPPGVPPHPYKGALRYEGEWAITAHNTLGNWNGYGKVFYRDGSIYQGQIVDGAFTGYGVFLKADKTRIEGKWNDGEPVPDESVKWNEDGLPLN